MTVKDCYEAIGADYQEVLRRLANEERVKRFLLKFPGDDSFSGLVKAVEEGDYETAFRAEGNLLKSVDYQACSVQQCADRITAERRMERRGRAALRTGERGVCSDCPGD